VQNERGGGVIAVIIQKYRQPMVLCKNKLQSV